MQKTPIFPTLLPAWMLLGLIGCELVDLCERRQTPARSLYILFFFLAQICALWLLPAWKPKEVDPSKRG